MFLLLHQLMAILQRAFDCRWNATYRLVQLESEIPHARSAVSGTDFLIAAAEKDPEGQFLRRVAGRYGTSSPEACRVYLEKLRQDKVNDQRHLDSLVREERWIRRFNRRHQHTISSRLA